MFKYKKLRMKGGGNARFPYFEGNGNANTNVSSVSSGNLDFEITNENIVGFNSTLNYNLTHAMEPTKRPDTIQHVLDVNTNSNSDDSINKKDRVRYYYGGGKGVSDKCFTLAIYPTGEAILENMKNADYCALTPAEFEGETGVGTGKKLLMAAFNLAKKKGATTLTLTDNSYIKLEDGRKFNLSTMYFLATGRTWYNTLIPSLIPIDFEGNKDIRIEKWQKRVLTNKWADVANRLPYYVEIPVDISDININENGSAMKVLNRIKDAKTDFFVKFEDEIVWASKIGHLNGTSWITQISQ